MRRCALHLLIGGGAVDAEVDDSVVRVASGHINFGEVGSALGRIVDAR